MKKSFFVIKICTEKLGINQKTYLVEFPFNKIARLHSIFFSEFPSSFFPSFLPIFSRFPSSFFLSFLHLVFGVSVIFIFTISLLFFFQSFLPFCSEFPSSFCSEFHSSVFSAFPYSFLN